MLLKKYYFFCGPFLKLSLNLLQYCFCFMFWSFDCEAHGILSLWLGIEPISPALESKVLTIGHPGRSWQFLFKQWFKGLIFLYLAAAPPEKHGFQVSWHWKSELKGCAFSLKCFSLEMTCITSAQCWLARTSYMSFSNCKGAGNFSKYTGFGK